MHDYVHPRMFESISECLSCRLKVVSKVSVTFDGYKNVIEHKSTNDAQFANDLVDNKFSISDVTKHRLRQRCVFLSFLYRKILCLEGKEKRNMEDLEKSSMEAMVAVGWEEVSPRTWRKWIYEFRVKEYFDVQYTLDNAKAKLSPFLAAHPKEKEKIRCFIREHLAELSCEKVQDYIQGTIFKEVFEDQSTKATMAEYIQQYGIKFSSLSTVLCWMHQLGCKYDSRRKSYYVDSHEAPETKSFRKKSGKNI